MHQEQHYNYMWREYTSCGVFVIVNFFNKKYVDNMYTMKIGRTHNIHMLDESYFFLFFFITII